jgi:predicted membrane channel-forming protein YqfA (hemolysin III family)
MISRLALRGKLKYLVAALLLVAVAAGIGLAQDAEPASDSGMARRFHSYGFRMPDGGPIYVETLNHMNSQEKGLIWEPYNTATAMLFGVVAVYWLFKIRGREKNLFFKISMPILLIGSLGGTLYHGLRASRWFLLMDVMPIAILLIGSVVYIITRLSGRAWFGWVLAVGGFAATVGLGVFMRRSGLAPFGPSTAYLMLVVYVIIPYTIFLLRTGREAMPYLILAGMLFLMAFAFRSIDLMVDLPMGTHFLWHTFGAFASASLITYLWRTRLLAPARRKTQDTTAYRIPGLPDQ